MAKINFVTKGRSGTVQYIEGSLFRKNVCEFYWEFGGADMIATIWFPKDDPAWDKEYPWAAGRRMEIMEFVAGEVRSQQFPSAAIQWEADRFHLVKA